jgi:hypothetical protein
VGTRGIAGHFGTPARAAGSRRRSKRRGTREADTEPDCEPDQRAAARQLGLRYRRPGCDQHAAQLPAGRAVCDHAEHEHRPADHHAAHVPARGRVRRPANQRAGDILARAFFSPSKAGRIIWGVGPVVLLPTATDNALGGEKFGVGPSAVVLMQPGQWTLGLLVNQIWSTSGASNRTDVNQTFLQPFANYNLGSGPSVGVSMEASGDWKADEKWTVPLLFNVIKVTVLGKRPVNFLVAAGPMVASPAVGANRRFRVASIFLFPR